MTLDYVPSWWLRKYVSVLSKSFTTDELKKAILLMPIVDISTRSIASWVTLRRRISSNTSGTSFIPLLTLIAYVSCQQLALALTRRWNHVRQINFSFQFHMSSPTKLNIPTHSYMLDNCTGIPNTLKLKTVA